MRSSVFTCLIFFAFVYGGYNSRLPSRGRITRSSPLNTTRGWIIDQDQSDDDVFAVRQRRFNKPELTWRISKFFHRPGLRHEHLTSAIKSALDKWSTAIPVHFHQVTNNSDQTDLDFRFLDSNIDDQCNNTFLYEQLAHCTRTNNPVGIHFNGNARWAVGDVEYPTYDIFTVALHEIGHSLGLGHSGDPDAVMFGTHTRTFENLADDDILSIQALYGRRNTLDNGVHALKSTPATARISSPISENGAHLNRSFCEPYRDYCGWQMQYLGYRVEQLARRNIYRCTLDKRGALVKYCIPECILDPSLRPYCPCDEGDRLCGYLVQFYYNVVPPSYHSKYQCVRSEAEGRMIWEEQLINETSTCRLHVPCNETRLYCGYEMLHYEFISSPNQSWQFYALYQCTDPYRPVEVCDGGCRYWKQLSDSFCTSTHIQTYP